MKKIARQVVRIKYSEQFSPDKFEGGNQLEMYELVKDGVAGLLNGGCFLRGGVDENVYLFFQVFIHGLTIFLRVKPKISVTQPSKHWPFNFIIPVMSVSLIFSQKTLSAQFLIMPLLCY
jgi:hypothetical protein